MAKLGIVSEAPMAHILAVVRLAMGVGVPGNCTHEPSIIGAAAGAFGRTRLTPTLKRILSAWLAWQIK
jgi:hypothetical protein